MTIQTIGGAHTRRKLSLNFGGTKRDKASAFRPAESDLSRAQLRRLVANMID